MTEKRKRETKAEREARWERMRAAPARMRALVEQTDRENERRRRERESQA